MTCDEFKKAQLRLGLTNAAMASHLGLSVTHVESLRRGYKLVAGRRVEVVATRRLIAAIGMAEELQKLKGA